MNDLIYTCADVSRILWWKFHLYSGRSFIVGMILWQVFFQFFTNRVFAIWDEWIDNNTNNLNILRISIACDFGLVLASYFFSTFPSAPNNQYWQYYNISISAFPVQNSKSTSKANRQVNIPSMAYTYMYIDTYREY